MASSSWKTLALELVERAANAAGRDELLAGVFSAIERDVGIDSASVVTLTDGSLWTWNKPAACRELWGARGHRYVRESLPMASIAERSGGVVLDREAYSPARRARLALYAEYMRALGGGSFVAVLAGTGRSITHVVSLSRHGRGAFRGAEVERLRLVRPALSVAARIQPGDPPRAPAPRPGNDRGRLTPREVEIVHYVARGMQNAEIAALLGTSPHTVRNQLVAIFRKLDVSTRAELAARAMVEPDLTGG